METIKSVLNLVTPNCYMAKIDIKDACYSTGTPKIFESFIYSLVCLMDCVLVLGNLLNYPNPD